MGLSVHGLGNSFPILPKTIYFPVWTCVQCTPKYACMHAHTHILTLLCSMIPKEFPYHILSFTGARITRYCLWYGVSHIAVSSPVFLIDQDTAAPVFSHLHPDANSLSNTYTHEAFSAFLSSLLLAVSTQPGEHWYPGSQAVGLLPWWVQWEAVPC